MGRGTTEQSDETGRRMVEFIRECQQASGNSPSVRQIGIKFAMGESTVHYHLKRLEKAGAISREKGQARAIRVLQPTAHVGGEEPGAA